MEELRAKRNLIKSNSEVTLANTEKIIDETNRVAYVAHNAKILLDDLDKEFEYKTGLQGNDIVFLFTAVGLQLARIVIINELTKIEKAGAENKKEEKLHEFQEKILRGFSTDEVVKERPYYASMEHIITKAGVPYDATAPLTDEAISNLVKKNRSWDFDLKDMIPEQKISLFEGANHRFSTLGHDPVLGLIFGTGNIMTNTITCCRTPGLLRGVGVPIITTNHVIYTSDFKDPRIATYGSTMIMLKHVIERTQSQPSAFVASLIKQIIHIGTDLYTPCGIQIPAANLILSNQQVEQLTKYISSGDLIKIGASAKLAELIDLLIGTLHTLMYDERQNITRDLYNVRTRKIILYSNTIATGSNVIWVTGNVIAGNETSLRQLDIAGLINILKRLRNDRQYIRKIKEEFVFGEFNKKIQGEALKLEEVVWD